MAMRIADTFTDSLARLTGEEQKAAKTTAFDLQLNPANPGMSFACVRDVLRRVAHSPQDPAPRHAVPEPILAFTRHVRLPKAEILELHKGFQ